MFQHKSAETVDYRRQKAKTVGYMLCLVTMAIGFAGWYLWKWYALPISIVIAVILDASYSIIERKRIQKKTCLNIDEQEMTFRESAVVSLDPTILYPEEYRAHLDSSPEDESDKKDYEVIWSRAKKIEVVGPDFFGRYSIYVDPKSNVAIFLPKSNKTLHIFIGDIFRAKRWIIYDMKGLKVKDKILPEEFYKWEINSKNIWYRGTGLPPGKPGYRGEVLSFEYFIDEINDEWLDIKIKEYIRMMGFTFVT
jgi:hypothetical protein